MFGLQKNMPTGNALIMLVVWDVKAQAYIGQPLFAPTRGVGERSFSDACSQKGTPFNDHPDDYELHEVGSFNVMNGEVIGAQRPVVFGKARMFIREA